MFTGSIRNRLRTLVGLFSVALLVIGVAGLWAVYSSNERLRSVQDDRVVPMGDIANLTQLMADNMVALYKVASVGTEKGAVDGGAATRQIEANIKTISDLWKKYRATNFTPAEERIAAAFEADRTRFVDQGLRPALKFVEAKKYGDLEQLLNETVVQLYEAAETRSEALMNLQVEAAAEEYAGAMTAFWVQTAAAVALLAFGLIVGVWIGWASIRAVISPLGQITTVLGMIAKGNYDNRVVVTQNDELGQVLLHFEDMQQKLNESREAERRVAKETAERAARLDALTKSFDAEVSEVLEPLAAASTEWQSPAGAMTETASQGSQRSTAVAAAAEQAAANVQTVASAAEELSSSIAEIGRQVSVSTGVAGQATREAPAGSINAGSTWCACATIPGHSPLFSTRNSAT